MSKELVLPPSWNLWSPKWHDRIVVFSCSGSHLWYHEPEEQWFQTLYCLASSPLQCSRLENPMDRGAWWALFHKVTKSQTRLKRLSKQASTVLSHASLLPGFLTGLPILGLYCLIPVWLIPHPHSTTSAKYGHTTRANGQFSVPPLLGHSLRLETSACLLWKYAFSIFHFMHEFFWAFILYLPSIKYWIPSNLHPTTFLSSLATRAFIIT